MGYFGELYKNKTILFAASLGMAFGFTINNYLNNIFIPRLTEEFGWIKSSVALIGLPAILGIIVQPAAGRLADKFGVKTVALFGVICMPLSYLALSLMGGSLIEFFLINVVQVVLVASTTGAVVYSRLIAQNFERARGAALALAACSPSVAGGIIAPFLSAYIDEHGWRSGYVATAAMTGLAGILAILLIPRAAPAPAATLAGRQTSPSYRSIVANPAFKLIAFGIAFCSLSVVVQTSQMKLIIEGMGVDSARASLMISLYAVGVIIGRLACGVALDRFPAHIVAATSLGLPGLGLAILALGTTDPIPLAVAVFLLGLSLGGEMDVVGYLIMRFFELRVYSTVLGIVVGTIAFSGALGSVLLSVSLKLTEGYAVFLLSSAGCAFLGSFLLGKLGNIRPSVQAPAAVRPAP